MTRAAVVTVAAFAVLALSGCSRTVDGYAAYTAALSATAHHEQTDISTAPTAAPSSVPVAPTVPSKDLTLAELVAAVNRAATKYWAEHGLTFTVMSISPNIDANPCPWRDNMAAVCDGTIYYDPHTVATLRNRLGDIGVTEVFAHEVGHAVEHYAGRDQVDHPTLEARADCASGAYTAFQFDIPESRAVELFDRTEMVGFTTGFETQRDGGDTVSVCTTYMMRGH